MLALAALPLLIWAAFTFGQRETATLALLLAGFTVWDMPRGPGPIAGIVSPESIAGLDAQMLQLAFLSLASVTGLLLAAVVADAITSRPNCVRHRSKWSAVFRNAWPN